MEEYKKQYIRPGHGDGHGKRVGRITEDNIVLGVSLILKHLLEEQGGYEVMLARDGDYYVSLSSRVKESKKFKADLLLAIHANSHSYPDKNNSIFGFEAFIHDELSDSRDNIFVAHLLSAYGAEFEDKPLMRNRGKKEDNFYLLRQRPAKANVLFELNFMTNPMMLAFMNSSFGQYRMSKGLFEGIKTYTNKLKRKA